MDKTVLIVCRDPELFGARKEAQQMIDELVSRVFVFPFSEAALDEVISYVKSHPIYTIITRGIWYIKLMESPYFRAHPQILIERMNIDMRVSMNDFVEFSNRGYRKILLLSANSPLGKEYYDETLTMAYSFASFQFFALAIDDVKNVRKQIEDAIELVHPDVLWGDAGDFSPFVSKVPMIDFSVRGYALKEMILNANAYGSKSILQEQNNRLISFLDTMINIVTEGVVLFAEDGTIVANNNNYVIKRLNKNVKVNENIQDVVELRLDELISLAPNTLKEITGHNYILNVIRVTESIGSLLYALILSSRSQVSSADLSARTQIAKTSFPARYCFEDIVCASAKIKNTIFLAQSYARHDETVLITGETGTGKELFASSIHRGSERSDRPFVAINCATLSENLIDSELFGYEKGSFTGALTSGKKGLFELAHQGTIFLDEISELPLHLQTRLLRVLQEKCITRIGGKEIIPIDVRVIAATNKDLMEQCRNGLFRFDLFYRLAVLELRIAPLRERPDDIIPLFQHFLLAYVARTSHKLYWDDNNIFRCLLAYPWKGNVRELENVALRTCLLSRNLKLSEDDVRMALSISSSTGADEITASKFTTSITNDLSVLEKEYINYLLLLMNNNKDAVCQFLRISKPTLWRKLNYHEAAAEKTEDR